MPSRKGRGARIDCLQSSPDRPRRETRDAIRLVFENGLKVDADIVVGADGVNSKVREYLLGPEPPRFSEFVAHRAIFPTEALRGIKIPDCTKWWGPDRHILVYFMTSKRDEVYVIGVVPRPTWDSDEASLPSSREALIKDFANFHPDLLRVLAVTTDVTLWPVYDRERVDRWSGGRIVLLGDSCHPCDLSWRPAAPWRSRTRPF